MIQITCKGNSAICTRTERLTSGMVGLQCEFVFDDAWDGLAKMAVFTAGNEKRDVLLQGAICEVPPEVMRKPGYQLVIGVYGTNADGTLVIPTCYAMCGGIGPGADPSGDESTDPTLPVWGQMQGMIGNLENLATVSKDNLVDAVNEVKQTADAKANAADLAPVATSGSYSDLFDKPTIPSVPTATIDANTAARHTHDNKTLLDSITEAVKTAWNTASEWVSTNGANVLSHLSDGVRHIAATERSAWNGKQDKLIAGENITIADDGKTISATGGGGGASVELDTTLSKAGKAADAKAVGDALADKQPKGDYLTRDELPDMTAYRTAEAQDVIDAGKQDTLIQSGASVGQIAKITAVDDTGKPTAWEAVDMPNGGGHWETVLDTVWQQDVINPTAFDSATGIFTCAEGELNNLELNKEYVFFQQCTKEGAAYNTILDNENLKVTKLSDTTFSINSTPPTTFVPTNVKFSRGAVLAITDIDAKKIRLTLDGQFAQAATKYNYLFYGVGKSYFGENVGYQQIRNAYQAYQQVTAEVESPYRIVGKILCGFNAPSQNGNFHFKNNSFCCPLVPYDVQEENERNYVLTTDGTKISNLYSTGSPWQIGTSVENNAILHDRLKIISGTKVKLERWVE